VVAPLSLVVAQLAPLLDAPVTNKTRSLEMTEEMLQQRVNFGRTHDPGVVRAKESETISEQKV